MIASDRPIRRSQRFLPWLCAVLALAGAVASASDQTQKTFPYEIHRETLDNGLSLLVVPFESPGVASFYTLVRAGSRNEVEPGKTGFAHFFEHMMFRGTKLWPEAKRRDLLAETGSDENGWTTDDYTCYSLTVPSARLPEMIALEADRVRNLWYEEPAFKTESQAVLGEYNKNYSNPEGKMDEVLRATAYKDHTYRHTTMGFIQDVRAMPEGFAYSKTFFNRFYVPANIVLIAVGDVDPAKVSALVRKQYGSWHKAGTPPAITPEPPQTAERRAHVPWEAQTVPRLAIAWHAPAGTDARRVAALRILAQALTGTTSTLYRSLVIERHIALAIGSDFESTRDPSLFTVYARVPKAEDLETVEAEFERAFEQFSAASVPAVQLDRARRRLRYDFLLGLSSAPRIAGALAGWTQLTGDPAAIEAQFAAVASVTPEEIAATAGQVFRPTNRTVVTLATEGAKRADGAESAAPAACGEPKIVQLPRPAEPTVVVRVAFRAGSVDDPPGLEGLTALTARAMAEGATRKHTLDEINVMLEPMAAGLRVDVDKEMTTFSGRVHRDDAAAFVGLLAERLTEPAFEPEDVARLRRSALEDIRSRLRNNDDENLGKEALSGVLYEGHPYGHYTGGTARALEAIGASDMAAHRARVFTTDRATLGVAGGFDASLIATLRDLGARLGCAPKGAAPATVTPPASLGVTNSRLFLVEKPTDSVAISIGFAEAVKRGDPDYPALTLAASWLGEHRQFVGYLQKRMRLLRGLNYGNYAYTEFFRQEGGSVYPAAGYPRSQHFFSIWIRPVEPKNGAFALKEAVYELRRVIADGIPEDQFERSRAFAIGYSRLKEQTLDRRLGMMFDDAFYGVDGYSDTLRTAWRKLTRQQVNDAIRRHWRPDGLSMVMVVRDGEAVKQEIASGAPSTIHYASPMEPAIRAEDAVIGATDLRLRPDRIVVVKAADLFEK